MFQSRLRVLVRLPLRPLHVPVQGAPLLCVFFRAPDLQSAEPCIPSLSFLHCPFLTVSFCTAPSSLSPLSSRFMFFVSSLLRSLLLFMFSLPCPAPAASSSVCSPGRSNPGLLLPKMFQSRASTPRMFQSGCVSSPDVPVQVSCVFPLDASSSRMLQSGGPRCLGCSSPWHWVHPPRQSSPVAVLESAPYAPIRGVILSYYPCCQRPVVLWCVLPWGFFSRALRRSSTPAPPRSSLRSLLSSPLPLPLPPFLASLPSALSLPPSGPSPPSPRLPFTPFVVALLGHALQLLVSMHACCYVFVQAHTYIHLLSFLLSHCSLALHCPPSLVTVSSLVPLFPLPFPCHMHVVLLWGAPCVLSSMPALCPLPPSHACTHFSFVWGTQSSSSSYACTLPPSLSCSLFPCSPVSRSPLHSCHTFLFIVTTTCATYYYRCLYVFMFHAIYLFTLWVIDSLYRARRLNALMTHAIYLLGCGLLVLGDAQE